MIKIIDIIRLILKNILLLILLPIIMAAMVFTFTINQKRYFKSKTIVYTGLASGMDISRMENQLFNYPAINNSFDNLINTIRSRETLEQVSMHLMAKHIYQKNMDTAIVSSKIYRELSELLKPDEVSLLLDTTEDATFLRILEFKNSSINSPIRKILNSTVEVYSISAITSNLEVKRLQTSDMLELSYQTIDPGVAQNTLFILIDEMFDRYKALKANESDDVLAYFQQQINELYDDLLAREQELEQYIKANGVINYYEQTKFIAEAQMDAKADLNTQEQQYSASKGSENKLSNTLSNRREISDINDKLVQLQAQLGKINNEITKSELNNNKTIRFNLSNQAKQIQSEIDSSISKLYTINNSSEGVNRNLVLNNYLDKSLSIEESQQKIGMIEKRIGELGGEVDRMAPIGTNIKKYQREIEVAEEKYLTTVKNYHEALLKKKNLELTKSLSVVDEPIFPLKKEPSKRIFLMLIAGMIGFILPFSIVLALYIFDNSIKNIHNAKLKTGLSDVLGVFGDLKGLDKSVIVDQLNKIHFNHLSSALRMQGLFNKQETKTPLLVCVFSLRSEEGKTYLSHHIANRFAEEKRNITCFFPEASRDSLLQIQNENLTQYEFTFFDEKQIHQIGGVKELESNTIASEVILIELPDLSNHQMPIEIIKDSSFNLMVLNSKRVWSESDSHLLQLYQQTTNFTPQILLNKMSSSELETVLGELPKQRSMIRMWFKKILSFNFNLVRI